MRAFALEQLAAHDEAEPFGRRHAEWMTTFLDHSIEDWSVAGGVHRRSLTEEHDNWREAVMFAVDAGDPDLGFRVAGLHTRAAAEPETGRWTASVMTIDGIDRQPGAFWMHYSMACACASANDFAALAHHVAAFNGATDDPHARSWMAPFDAILATVDGRDAAQVLADAVAVPGLSALERANLHLYDTLVRNLPPAIDPDARGSRCRPAPRRTTGDLR